MCNESSIYQVEINDNGMTSVMYASSYVVRNKTEAEIVEFFGLSDTSIKRIVPVSSLGYVYG